MPPRPPRSVHTRLVLLLALTAAGCGGGDGPAGPPGGGGGGSSSMSAAIGGAPWTSAANLVSGLGASATPGAVMVQGSALAGGTARSVNLALGFIPGPGVYPIGVNPGTTPGGVGTVVVGSDAYTTPLSGAAGTVTVTSVSAERIAGTFAFTARHQAPGDGRTVVVTGGEFDVRLSPAYVAPTAAQRGSTLQATIGGAAWTGATVVAMGGSGTYAATAATTARTVSLIVGPVTAPGTYPLTTGTPAARVTVRHGAENDACCWGGTAGDVGSIVVTSVSAERIAGTFSGTLAPSPGGTATTPLMVTGGTFDLRVAPDGGG